MWVFLIARESKSISELILSQLAYEKYNYAQSYNIGQSCQMSLSHLWWLQCVWWLWCTSSEWEQLCLRFLEAAAASGLWDVISALPMAAVLGAPCEQWFAQVALAAAADGMAGAGHRSWRSILISFWSAPVPSPELCPVKVEGELDPCPLHYPSSRGILPPGKQVMSLPSWPTYLLPARSTTCNSFNPSASSLQPATTSCKSSNYYSCCMGNWL